MKQGFSLAQSTGASSRGDNGRANKPPPQVRPPGRLGLSGEAQVEVRPAGVGPLRPGAVLAIDLARLQGGATEEALQGTGLGLPRDHPVRDLADRVALRAVAVEHQLAVEVEHHQGIRPPLINRRGVSILEGRGCLRAHEPGLTTRRLGRRGADQRRKADRPEPLRPTRAVRASRGWGLVWPLLSRGLVPRAHKPALVLSAGHRMWSPPRRDPGAGLAPARPEAYPSRPGRVAGAGFESA